jgi:anti-sigma regulatory factor (Ser/Thr protein kinase)
LIAATAGHTRTDVQQRAEQDVCHQAQTALPSEPASVAVARRWVLDQLAHMYGRIDGFGYDVETVVSELVTNAVRADAQHLVLTIDGHANRVTVATIDDAPGVPVKQQPHPGAVHGRGLVIVDGLAQEWGFAPDGVRKTVWAALPVPRGAGVAFECTET